MAMTRKEVKEYIEDPTNWAVVQGNQFVQVAILRYPADFDILQTQYRYDLNHWKRTAKRDDYQPRIVWQGGSFFHYDPKTSAMFNSISRTQLENMIYEMEHANEI